MFASEMERKVFDLYPPRLGTEARNAYLLSHVNLALSFISTSTRRNHEHHTSGEHGIHLQQSQAKSSIGLDMQNYCISKRRRLFFPARPCSA